MLVCFIMVFNFWLKSLWHVPLNPNLHSLTWAFPSGHMHLFMALFGWLAWEYRKPWLLALAAIWGALTAHGLVACGYHDYPAVFASIGIGFTEIIVYHYINQRVSFQQLPQLGLAMAALCLMMILNLPHTFPIGWIWQAESMLMTFSCALFIQQRYLQQGQGHITSNITRTIQGILLIFALYLLSLSHAAWAIDLFILFLTIL